MMRGPIRWIDDRIANDPQWAGRAVTILLIVVVVLLSVAFISTIVGAVVSFGGG